MTVNSKKSGHSVRERLSHPVVAADGHWLEFGPTIREELRKIGGEDAV